ncbi:MAG TPA: DUF4198 domain-containing protein [Lysobacter sp.]|nr:DUF4198 domain-containing protein [Lysobacter sp.]
MKRHLLACALALASALPLTAAAHKMWLQPSQTVVAGGSESWITVDAAVSNDIFHFGHVPLRLDNLRITGPDGQPVQPQNGATGKYRSVFDVQLAAPGTYRLAIVNDGLNGQWEENGQPKRWRGNAATFATEVPKNAKNLQVSQALGRVETFVTSGAPNEAALAPSGRGLELVPITHPNDLFAGEAANFRMLVDGKPAKDLEIEIIQGGTRYRDAQDEIKVRTDAKGEFSVTWPQAGMYWLEATAQDDRTDVPQAKQRRLTYVATLEVLPQ